MADSLAIVFMHAWKYPAHERLAARLAREAGFAQVSVSHEVSPLVKIVGRGDTTVVDAYLSPILRDYVEPVAEAELGGCAGCPPGGTRLLFMMSSGGLTSAESVPGQGCDPVGPRRRRCRRDRNRQARRLRPASSASTWAARRPMSAHYDGELERAFETEVAGVRMRAPMMRIHTVAAGGGSILHLSEDVSRPDRIRPAPIPARPVTGAADR